MWVKTVFIDHAWLFLKIMRQLEERGERQARGISALLERHGVRKGSRVLEIGCGNGRVAIPLARLGYRVTCLDISRPFIEDAERRAAGLEGFEAIVGDAWRLDEILEGEYDAVYTVWTTLIGYDTVERDMELLQRLYRITRPDGLYVIASTINRDQVVARTASDAFREVISELGDHVVVENPVFDPIDSTIRNTWIFYRKDGRNLFYEGEFSFTLRVYTPTELKTMAEKVGWRFLTLYHDLHEFKPYKPGQSPLNMVFQKPILEHLE